MCVDGSIGYIYNFIRHMGSLVKEKEIMID